MGIKAQRNNGAYFVQMEQMIGGKKQKVGKVYPRFIYPFFWNGYEFFAHKDGAFYSVTEKISGMAIAQFREKPNEAIADALIKLEEAGVEKFKSILSRLTKAEGGHNEH